MCCQSQSIKLQFIVILLDSQDAIAWLPRLSDVRPRSIVYGMKPVGLRAEKYSCGLVRVSDRSLPVTTQEEAC